MTIKNKIILSITILFFLSIVYLFLFFFPLFRKIKNLSGEIITNKEKLITLNKRIENIEKLKKNYQKFKSEIKKIDTLFVKAEVPIEFINFLEKTSEDCHLSIQKIFPSLGGGKKPWPYLNFQITVVGSFSNFLKFLEKLESSQYLTEIFNLNVNRLSQTELNSKDFEKFSLGDVKIDFSLKVYAK